eukprot:1133220-Amphidinium_carterae.2
MQHKMRVLAELSSTCTLTWDKHEDSHLSSFASCCIDALQICSHYFCGSRRRQKEIDALSIRFNGEDFPHQVEK